MARPNPPYAGACLCGSVQVNITAPPLLSLACHCRDCQKLTASAYSLTTMFPKESFSYAGELICGGLRSSGRTHHFCKSCLNFIYSEIGEGSGRINLRTSILDDAGSFEPFVELMTDEKLPWAGLQTPRTYAQFPQSLGDLHALMEAYAQS